MNLKPILGYTAGFIFLVAIVIYLYMLIVDNIEKSKHSTEEIVWIYAFLVVLIIGFIISYYTISKSELKSGSKLFGRKLEFGGVSKLPSRPAYGKPKIIVANSKFKI